MEFGKYQYSTAHFSEIGAVNNHGNGLSDERFGANYFSNMVFLAYILNFINIWDGPLPTYGWLLWFFERISLKIKNERWSFWRQTVLCETFDDHRSFFTFIWQKHYFKEGWISDQPKNALWIFFKSVNLVYNVLFCILRYQRPEFQRIHVFIMSN